MIKINSVKTDKSHITQPKSCEDGILPKLPAGYLVVGSSGSGKSTVVHAMLSDPKLLGGAFNYIVCFSDVKCDDVLKALDLPKDNYICGEDFTEDKIKNLLKKMEQNIENEGLKDCCTKYKICMVFDDILSRQKLLKSDTFKMLATANRHFLVSYLMLTQYYKLVPSVFRQNVSGLIMFPSSLSECIKVAEEHCDPGMSKKEFLSLMKHATKEKYSFLFINRKAEPGKRIRKGFDTILSIGGENDLNTSEENNIRQDGTR